MSGAAPVPTPTGKAGSLAAMAMISAQPASEAAANPGLSLSSKCKMAIMELARRLAWQLQAGLPSKQHRLVDECFALARFIDYVVSNCGDNDVSIESHDLAIAIKQVYAHRNENFLQAAVTLLMISVKNACKSNWFAADDSDELINMANEIRRCFGMSDGIISNPKEEVEPISNIMQRFFPLMELNSLIAVFKVKPGYEVLVADVYISKAIAAGQSLRLFVARTDEVDTSSCIVTPPEVNFLINGKGLKSRNTIFQDKNPQLPTDITGMIKPGINLLQAIGIFDGNYIIAFAVMSERNSVNAYTVQNYNHPDYTEDMEIVGAPSMISLNCPISMVRIRTPVKGQLCKHLQCFDYDSFMNLNSKNPSWCCPICKQSVSFVDIRIDQYMAKILKDAEFYVSNVIIFADKSWKTEQLQGSTSLSWSNTHKAPNEDSLTCVPYSRSFITFSADVMHASSQHMHKTTEVSLSFSAPANSLGHLAHGDRRTATNSNPDKHHQLGTCTMISHSTHLQQRTQVSQVQTFEELVGCSPENHASTRIQSAQEMALAGRQQVVGTQVREADKAMPSSLRPDTLRNWHTYQNTHIMDADRSSRLSSAELRHMQNSTVIRSVNPACSSCNVPLARFPARYGGFPHPQHQLSSSQYDKARLQTVRNQANFRGVEMSTTEHDPGGHRNEHA